MKRKIIIRYSLLLLLVIIAAVAIYIYKEYNRTHKDTARLKADYSLAATDLIKEFETNEQASNKKYWDIGFFTNPQNSLDKYLFVVNKTHNISDSNDIFVSDTLE